MENAIRILTVFSQSGTLAFMFLVLMFAIVVVYITSRMFRAQKRHDAKELAELKVKMGELQYRLNKQIEVKVE